MKILSSSWLYYSHIHWPEVSMSHSILWIQNLTFYSFFLNLLPVHYLLYCSNASVILSTYLGLVYIWCTAASDCREAKETHGCRPMVADPWPRPFASLMLFWMKWSCFFPTIIYRNYSQYYKFDSIPSLSPLLLRYIILSYKSKPPQTHCPSIPPLPVCPPWPFAPNPPPLHLFFSVFTSLVSPCWINLIRFSYFSHGSSVLPPPPTPSLPALGLSAQSD